MSRYFFGIFWKSKFEFLNLKRNKTQNGYLDPELHFEFTFDHPPRNKCQENGRNIYLRVIFRIVNMYFLVVTSENMNIWTFG
jgi:hypothetical protein